jgi:hypothetical protein
MRYRWDPVYPTGRHMSSGIDARIRASDDERNEVAEKLSRHFTDGRLDQADFQERLGRAMGAKTRGDLDGLFDDLPRLATESPPSAPRRRRLLPLVAILLLAAVAAGTTASLVHLPWLLVVLAGLFAWHRGHRRALARRGRLELGQ